MPTEGEKLKIRRLLAAGRSYQQIAAEMPGWTPLQCRSFAIRAGYVKPQPKAPPPAPKPRDVVPAGPIGREAAGIWDFQMRPHESALAERARRLSRIDTRPLVGRVMGDPEPGRSALDKRRMADA